MAGTSSSQTTASLALPISNNTSSKSDNLTSTTNSTTPSTTPIHCDNKAGTIAGAAVGTGLGVALLACLLVFVFTRFRRRSNTHRSASFKSPPQSPKPLMDIWTLPKSPGAVEAITLRSPAWTEYLPKPADSDSIRRAMQSLYEQIEIHVESFYNETNIQRVSEAVQAELYKLDSEMLPPSLHDMMIRSQASSALIKHTLAHLTFSNIDFNDPSSASFLPSEFVGLNKALQRSERSAQRPGTYDATSRMLCSLTFS